MKHAIETVFRLTVAMMRELSRADTGELLALLLLLALLNLLPLLVWWLTGS